MEGINTFEEFIGSLYGKYSFLNYNNEAGLLNEEQINQVKNDFMMNPGAKVMSRFATNALPLAKQEWQQAWANIGLNATREDSIQAICYVWCMGHLGFELSEVMELDKNGTLKRMENGEEKTYTREGIQEAFHQFCENHPLANLDHNQQELERFKTNMKTWVDIFTNCNEKSKKYTLPQINYDNPQEVAKYLDEFYLIRSLIINVSQEFTRITGVQNSALYSKSEALNAAGSEEKFQDIAGFWEALQGVLMPLINGYLTPVPIGNRTSEYMKALAQIADGRYKVSSRSNTIKAGRKLGELADEAKEKHWDLYLFNTDNKQLAVSYGLVAAELEGNAEERKKIISDGNGERCNVINFLTGEDKGLYELMSEQRFDDAKKSFIESETYNMESDVEKHLLMDAGLNTRFPDGKTFKQKLTELDPNDPDAMKNFLNEKSTGGNTVRFLVAKCFGNSLSFSMRSFALACGVRNCDILLLDGKTATQLYGAKYQGVTNPLEKDLLLEAEILRNIAKGESEVSVRRFGLNEKDEPVEVDPVKLYLKERKMFDLHGELGAYVATVEDIAAELDSYKELFSQTQFNRKANFDEDGEIPAEGSNDYALLGKTLQNAIEILRDKDSTPIQIRKALTNLKTAANNYVVASKNFSLKSLFKIFFKTEDFKSERVNCATKLYNSIDALMGRYNTHQGAVGQSGLIVETNSHSHVEAKDASIRQLNTYFRKYANNRNPEKKETYLSDNSTLKAYISYQAARMLSLLENRDVSKERQEIHLAKEYLFKHLNNKLIEYNLIDIAPQNVTFDFLKPFYQIDSELENLANNPVFVAWMNKNPKDCIENYEKKCEELLKASREKAHSELGEGDPADKLVEAINNESLKISLDNIQNVYKEFGKVIKNVLLCDNSHYGKMFAIAAGCDESFDSKLEDAIINIVLQHGNLLTRPDGVQLTLNEINDGSILAVILAKGDAISKACFTPQIVNTILDSMTSNVKVENNIQNEDNVQNEIKGPQENNNNENEIKGPQENNNNENEIKEPQENNNNNENENEIKEPQDNNNNNENENKIENPQEQNNINENENKIEDPNENNIINQNENEIEKNEIKNENHDLNPDQNLNLNQNQNNDIPQINQGGEEENKDEIKEENNNPNPANEIPIQNNNNIENNVDNNNNIEINVDNNNNLLNNNVNQLLGGNENFNVQPNGQPNNQNEEQLNEHHEEQLNEHHEVHNEELHEEQAPPADDINAILQKITRAGEENVITREEIIMLCERYHIIMQSTTIPAFENEEQKEEFVQDAVRAGFNGSRFDSMSTVYRLYLMSEKGLSAQQAFQMLPGDENERDYRRDFMQFMKQNPLREVDADQERISKSAWVRVYKNALNKINEYRFPQIDYTNPQEVMDHKAEIVALAKLPINYGQEFEMFTQAGDINITYDVCGGQEEYANLLDGVGILSTFAQNFKNAYSHPTFIRQDDAGVAESTNGAKAYTACTDAIFSRSVLNSLSQRMAGKSVAELKQEATSQDLYYPNGLAIAQNEISAAITSNPDNIFSTDEIDANLTGAKSNLKNFCSGKVQEGILKGRDNFNVEEYNYYSTDFVNELSSSREFFSKNPLGENAAENEAVVLAQNSPYMKKVAEAFMKISVSGENAQLLKALGKKPSELFHIGGKTPEELWGGKYAHLDEENKEKMYQAEICNQIINGLEEVKTDVIQIDQENNIVTGGTCIIVHDALDAQNQIEYIRKFDSLKTAVEKLLDSIKAFNNAVGAHGKNEINQAVKDLTECLSYLQEKDPNRVQFTTKGNFEKAKELFDKVPDIAAATKVNADFHNYGTYKTEAQNLMNEVAVLHEKVGAKASPQITGNKVEGEGRLSSYFSMDGFRDRTENEFRLRDLLVLGSNTPETQKLDVNEESYDSLTEKVQKRSQHQFISNLDRNAIRKKFGSVRNGKIVKRDEDIKDFAIQNKEWLNSQFVGTGKVATQSMLNTFQAKASDFFTIDGDSPSEKYQAAIEGVEDADQKEAILQACILRDICNGNSTIRCNMYELPEGGEEYSFSQNSNTVSIKSEPMTGFVDKFIKFDLEEQHYQNQFKSIMEELLKTQNNPMGNMAEGAKDGSDLYRDMFNALKKVIELSDENLNGVKSHSKEEFDRALDDLKEKSTNYFNSRGKIKLLGWGSPWTEKGKRRKGLAGAISKLADERKEHYEQSTKIVNNYTKQLITSNGETLEDSEYGKLREYVLNVKKNHTVSDNVFDGKDTKFASNILSKTIVSDDFYNNPNIPEDEKYQKAKTYLKKYYEANKGKIDMKTMNTLVNYYPEKVKELGENRLFISLYEKYGADEMVKHWPKHEKQAETGIKKALMDVRDKEMLHDGYSTRTYSEYVANINGEKFRRQSGMEGVNAKDTIRQIAEKAYGNNATDLDKKNLDDCYRRLAMAVVTQIAIYDEVIGKRMRTFISLNEKFSSDFVAVTMTAMKEAEVLKGSNLSTALKRLESGRLAGEMSNVFKKGGKEIQNSNQVVKESEFKMNKPGEFKSAIKMN